MHYQQGGKRELMCRDVKEIFRISELHCFKQVEEKSCFTLQQTKKWFIAKVSTMRKRFGNLSFPR